MTTPILLPPLAWPYTGLATNIKEMICARDLEVAKAVLEAAAKQVRDSGVCPFAVADGIAATEVKHHE
jgi:hypothetical protein